MAQAVKSVENATAGVESAAAKAQDVQDAQDAQEVKALFTEKVEELGEAWAATEDKARTIFCAEPSFLSRLTPLATSPLSSPLACMLSSRCG